MVAGELITYADNGDVTQIESAWDNRPVVGEVVSDLAGTVTYTDRLPAPITVKVAPGGAATPGQPAVSAGAAGYNNAPRLGAGNTLHFVAGVFASAGQGGDSVEMHPIPHWCPGADVE
ncbi:MAG: hypothetical protein IT372_42610 [Polyangiaceae bacterium]|nr:hypothetical protein [Polyangiaceae bacterium]